MENDKKARVGGENWAKEEKDLPSSKAKEEKENEGEACAIIYDCDFSEDENGTDVATSEDSKVEDIITIVDVHNSEVIHAKINKKHFKTRKSSKSKKKNYTTLRKKNFKAGASHKDAIVDMNIEMKREAMELMKREYELKIEYQTRELAHQEIRHNFEMRILNYKLAAAKLEFLKLKNEKTD